jgi:rod shape-determining protein MreB
MEALLRFLAPKKRLFDGFRRPRVVVSVPLDRSPVESRAVYETVVHAGGRDVRLVPKTIAAAVGLGLPVDRPSGHFILDIGGGTTEIGVVSSSGIVTQSSTRKGGASLNDAIRGYMKRKCNLLIGDQTAERLKIQMGTAYPTDDMYTAEVCGRDLISGVPKTVQLNSEELREALEEPVAAIVENVRETLERTPPEIASDLYERGIMMVGGGSLLPNLDFRLRELTGLPVIRAEDPANAVVQGAGAMLEDPRRFARFLE